MDTSAGPSGLAEADACTLADLAEAQRFESCTLLLGAAATRSRVRASLHQAARACLPGDLFMLTFSGHGGRRAGIGASPEALRGTWVLFDASLDDAEMRAALAEFAPGVRVLVISDSCHGGVPSEECGAPPPEVAASVLVLAACGPESAADGPGLPGHFTTALVRTWSESREISDYGAFCDRLAARMPEYQRPNLHFVGARDPRFESQRPFTI